MPHKKIFLALAFALALASPGLRGADPQLYKIDPAHATVGFSARHFTVSQVRGQFTQFSGDFQVDEKQIPASRFEVTLQAASLTTNLEQRDTHLKSADFLDVQNHPTLTFKSKRIEKAGDGYVAWGDLTIRGVTREVPLRFTLVGPIKDPLKFSRIGVEAATTINRHDFGASWNRVMEGGGLFVGDEVKIEINVELVRIDPATGKPLRLE